MTDAAEPEFTACVLGFDTSTERLAIGLQVRARPKQVVNAEGGARASATLLPQVHALLARAGVELADIDFVAFGRGPGAFTGLRTACAVVQGLARGLGKPVLPIDSLLIVAEDARFQHAGGLAACDVGVAMDARMGEVYGGVYRWQGGCWQALLAPALYSLPAWAEAVDGHVLTAVAGSALAAHGPRLRCPAGAVTLPLEHDRAAALLRLAVQAARAGAGLDAEHALPLYLRDKVALTTREREAAREAALQR